MISLCTSWALLSLSIVTLMVYLPVEISTAVLSFYLYNMVPTMLLGSYFLLNPLLQRKSNERNGSFRIELVIWYGTFLALAVVKSYLNLLACSCFSGMFSGYGPHFRAEISSSSLCVSWGRAPTCLEFPRRLPLSRCRAGEWPDDKIMFILGALISLQCCTLWCTFVSGNQI